MISSDLSPHPFSPGGSRPRSATTNEIPMTSVSATPIITAIPPSPATFMNGDFALQPLSPLNLAVLTEEPQPGSGAGKLLTEELERILSGFAHILDVVGNGLTVLETQTLPLHNENHNGNGEFDFGSLREKNENTRERMDSLTSSSATETGITFRR
jgi:hypothetical protein